MWSRDHGFEPLSCELILFKQKPTSPPPEGQAWLGTEAAFLKCPFLLSWGQGLAWLHLLALALPF